MESGIRPLEQHVVEMSAERLVRVYGNQGALPGVNLLTFYRTKQHDARESRREEFELAVFCLTCRVTAAAHRQRAAVRGTERRIEW